MGQKSLDDFLAEYGNPGRCQLLCISIIIVVMMQWTMVQQFNIIAAYVPDHHCKMPTENWNWTLNESIPQNNMCNMYANPLNHSEGLIPCPNGFEFDTIKGEIYPTNDFNLVCDREHLFRLSLTVPYVGVMVGGLIFGYLSDIYGRKKMLNFLMPLLSALSIGTTYSHNLTMFIILRFLLGAVAQGVQTVCVTYSAELFRRQMRTVMSFMFGIIAAVLLPVQSLMVYFLLTWRTAQLIQGILIIISIISTWFLPESVTWLISEGKLEMSEKILIKFAKFNNIPLPPTLTADLKEQNEEIMLQKGSKSKSQGWKNLKLLFSNSALRKIMLSTMFMMFANACVSNGLSFSISTLEGNLYTNYLINAAIQIVILTISLFLFSRYGRVKIFLILFISSGLTTICAYILIYYFKDGHETVQTIATYMALISRNLVAAITANIVTYSSELLPTLLRATGLGISITASRLGSTISPEILYTLNYFWEPLPHTVYGAMSLLSALAITFLPETFNKSMPRTVEDVEKIMNKIKTVPDEEKPLLKHDSLSKSFSSVKNVLPDLSRNLVVNQKLKLSTSSSLSSKSF